MESVVSDSQMHFATRCLRYVLECEILWEMAEADKIPELISEIDLIFIEQRALSSLPTAQACLIPFLKAIQK